MHVTDITARRDKSVKQAGGSFCKQGPPLMPMPATVCVKRKRSHLIIENRAT